MHDDDGDDVKKTEDIVGDLNCARYSKILPFISWDRNWQVHKSAAKFSTITALLHIGVLYLDCILPDLGMWDFVMDKSGAGAGFLRELRFPLPIYIPSALHNHLHCHPRLAQ
jgi:hypothetical protein